MAEGTERSGEEQGQPLTAESAVGAIGDLLEKTSDPILQDENGTVAPKESRQEEASPEPAEEQQEESAVEEDVEQKAGTEETEESTEPDDESVEVETLSELAEHLGVEVGDMYNIRIPMTGEDGEKVEVSLGEWKDGYRAQQATTKARDEAAALKEKLSAERLAAEQEWAGRMGQADKMIQFAEQQLMSEMNAINWQQLQAEHPATFAAQRQIMLERQAAIKEAKESVNVQAVELQKQQQTRMSEHRADTLKREAASLSRAIPEWTAKPEVAKAEKQKLADYMVSNGFTTAELENMVDHRAIVITRKAMMYDELQKKADVTTKKVVRIGKKILTPGTKSDPKQAKRDSTGRFVAKAKKTGSHVDAAAAIAALGMADLD